jgi:hypothetical protein
VLISIYDSDLKSAAQSNGEDIVFADNDKNKLPYEIELFNQSYNSTDARLIAWVKVNLTDLNDNVFWMYYNNSGASNQQNASQVWSDFKGVYHLKESGVQADSSAGSHNSTGSDGTPDYLQTGKIGNAVNFDAASNEYITFGNVADFDFSDNYTISAWFKTSQNSAYAGVMGKLSVTASPYKGYSLQVHNAKPTLWFNGVATSGPSNANDNQWHFLYATRSGSNNTLYLDGGILQNNYTDSNSTANSNSFYIGSWGNTQYDFTGVIDEVTLTNMARSLAWMNVSYQNQNNPSGV